MDQYSRIISDYREWPALLRELAAADYSGGEPIEGSAFIFGMGGSGHGARIISRCLKGRVQAVNDFRARTRVGRGDLAVALSVSGETLETINALREAVAQGAEGVAVAGGGKLLEVASALGARAFRVRVLSSPRSSFPSVYAPPSMILESYGVARGAAEHMLKLAEVLEGSMEGLLRDDGEPATIAEWMRGRKIVVYASWHGEPLASRLSAMLNEYAKTRCYLATAPELAHNEIEAVDGSEGVLVIRDRASEDPEVRASLDSVEELVEERGSALLRVELPSDMECLVRYGYGVALLDLAALRLARMRGIEDPYSTPNISRYKEKLRLRVGPRAPGSWPRGPAPSRRRSIPGRRPRPASAPRARPPRWSRRPRTAP
jgi:bifunctional phosphoglucose/phosphomannose isomerase